MRNASLITKAKVDNSKVGVGATVELHDIEFDEKLSFRIMGSIESDPMSGKISNESPMGKALLGKAKGDLVEVNTPAGIQKYKILGISY